MRDSLTTRALCRTKKFTFAQLKCMGQDNYGQTQNIYEDKDKVNTWVKLKTPMKQRFIPSTYKQQLFVRWNSTSRTANNGCITVWFYDRLLKCLIKSCTFYVYLKFYMMFATKGQLKASSLLLLLLLKRVKSCTSEP